MFSFDPLFSSVNLTQRRKNFPAFSALRLRAILWISALVSAIPIQATTFFYTYGDQNGGVAVVEIQDGTGAWKKHEALSATPILADPMKLAVSEDGKNLIVFSSSAPKAVVLQIQPEFKILSDLKLDSDPKEVRASGDQALMDASDGWFYLIDLKTGKITKTWNAREGLKPPGRTGEDISLLPDRNLGLATFQKDGKKGKDFGSRLIALSLKDLTPLWDLPLPRNHPELHIQGNLKEQGPNPEVIFVAPGSDTIALTLDLYGAVAFAKLSSALAGQWENLEYVPSSINGSWGVAFPDRGALFTIAGKDYLLISNASENGGLALFKVADHKLLQTFPASAGGENPAFLPKSSKAVTCISGKIKTRDSIKLEKEYKPENYLLVFDLTPLSRGGQATVERISFDKPVRRVQAVDPENTNLLFLVLGIEDSEVALYDITTHKILHREAAKGPVARVAAWRNHR